MPPEHKNLRMLPNDNKTERFDYQTISSYRIHKIVE